MTTVIAVAILVAGVVGFVLFARYNTKHNSGDAPKREDAGGK